jgi:hypothetical protein
MIVSPGLCRCQDGPVLLTPCGVPFFSLGVNAMGRTEVGANPEGVDRWERFAATRAEWAARTRRRLPSLGVQHGWRLVAAAC